MLERAGVRALLRLGPGRSRGESVSESTSKIDEDPETGGCLGGGFDIFVGFNKTKPLTASLLQLLLLPREVLVSTT